MCGAEDRGGVHHRRVAYSFALLVFGSLHGVQWGHAVGELAGTGDQGLDVVLDGGLVERVNL